MVDEPLSDDDFYYDQEEADAQFEALRQIGVILAVVGVAFVLLVLLIGGVFVTLALRALGVI